MSPTRGNEESITPATKAPDIIAANTWLSRPRWVRLRINGSYFDATTPPAPAIAPTRRPSMR